MIFFANHSLPIFWKSGWIAILDNERLTHARPSFTLQEGETRKLGAMMGIPKNRIGAKFQNEGKFNGLQLLS